MAAGSSSFYTWTKPLILKGGRKMKRISVFSLATVIVLGVSFMAMAGHQHMVIPYEAQALGYSSSMPIPAGGDVRHHIISQSPYKNWQTWPGKGKMYKGTKPHGAFLTTYVNDIAIESIKGKKGLANNSIIVKENYSPDKKLVAVTVMYKVKGYNPDGGDWFWAKYGADLSIMAEGKVNGCLGCHSAAKANDYVFTGKVK